MKRYILRQGLKLLQLHGHSISKYNLPELIFSRDAIFQDLCIIWINFSFFQKQCCCKLCISQDVAKVPPDGQLTFHGNSSFELKRIVSLVLHLMLLQIHQSRCCQGHLLLPSCNPPPPQLFRTHKDTDLPLLYTSITHIHVWPRQHYTVHQKVHHSSCQLSLKIPSLKKTQTKTLRHAHLKTQWKDIARFFCMYLQIRSYFLHSMRVTKTGT